MCLLHKERWQRVKEMVFWNSTPLAKLKDFFHISSVPTPIQIAQISNEVGSHASRIPKWFEHYSKIKRRNITTVEERVGQ